MHDDGDVAPLCRTSDVRCNSIPIGFCDALRFVGADFLILAILAALLASMLGCGGGSAGTGSQVMPPSNLTYPQTNIAATVGVAISTDTPMVSGTVGSYTVSPALPAGLSLSTSSGTISGTPTAQSAQATYTVRASNSAGSTTAKVQITVSMPVTPPSNLVYPQTTLTLEVGQPFASDIPSFSGAVTAFSVSPTLPAGLSLDPNTGALYGVASASASSNIYTMKASNAGGNTTTTVTLTVNPALVTLLDLGSANETDKILAVGFDVLTLDSSGHWVLINYSSGTQLASGEQGGNVLLPLEMAGTTFVVGITNGLEVRSTTDGHLLSIISFPMNGQTTNAWWKLASDGSYISAGSKAGLTTWSPSGSLLLSRAGDYSAANAFAAPGQILVALGPAGQNVIETVSVASGSSSVGPTFSGNFNTWFTDGKYFLTNLANDVWTYDTTSTELSFLTFPQSIGGGWGEWVWTLGQLGVNQDLSIYALGSSTPAAVYTIDSTDVVIPDGSTIGVLTMTPTVTNAVSVIDLSGASPTETNYTSPTAYNQTYGAFSASQWLVGNVHGAVVDGASLSSTVRYLSQGTAFEIAGGNNTVAVAVANGNVYVFDPANTTPQATIGFDSSQVAISADGTVLAASYVEEDAQYHPDETLNVFAIPTGTVTNSWPYQFGGTNLFAFSLATSGNNIGQATGTYGSSGWQYQRQVTAITGGPVIWSDTPSSSIDPLSVPPPLLSPNGDLIAAASDTRTPSAVTTIYQNGTAVAAVPGFAVGWIDESHLLVDEYVTQFDLPEYNGCTIYSPNGTVISSPPLPEIQSFQSVSAGLIYTPDTNTIYSTSTGGATWSSNYPYGGVGATTGTDVVFLSGARVVVQSQ